MLVVVVKDSIGRTQRFPRFQIATVADGGAFHVKDQRGFHHWWPAREWSHAHIEEEQDDEG